MGEVGRGWQHLIPPSRSGAGQDVGRSCILVSIGGKNVMLDCGMHMGFNDDVSPEGRWRSLEGPHAACSLLLFSVGSQALELQALTHRVGTVWASGQW